MMRVFMTNQKHWLIELRENNLEFKRSRLPQEFRDQFGGDLLYRSTVGD